MSFRRTRSTFDPSGWYSRTTCTIAPPRSRKAAASLAIAGIAARVPGIAKKSRRTSISTSAAEPASGRV
jgi:hypothetical protein